jgi:hypothetical protein
MNSPLEDRGNPSSWAALLDRALPALDHVFGAGSSPIKADHPEEPDWTLGGGTAIALRIGHRISKDVDLFVRASVKRFSPAANPAAAAISPRFRYPGHYVKFELPDGEIDFLSPSLLTTPGYTAETFKGRAVALETLDEVIVKKVRFRSSQFTARDIFDLAAVARRSKTITMTLASECYDLLPQLKGIIEARKAAGLSLHGAIRALAPFQDLLDAAPEEALRLVDEASDLARNTFRSDLPRSG